MKHFLSVLGVLGIMFGFSVSAHAEDNLAYLYGTATQSSMGYYANRVIDGSTNGIYGERSVSHTYLETKPWWQVDLGSMYSLENIVIWNRTDCCQDRLSNFHVSVMDNWAVEVWGQDFFTDGAGYPDPYIDIPLPDNTYAQFIKIQLNSVNVLSIAEIQVFEASRPVAPEPVSSLLFISGGAAMGLRRFCKKRIAQRG